jgi:hypothetical protein
VTKNQQRVVEPLKKNYVNILSNTLFTLHVLSQGADEM